MIQKTTLLPDSHQAKKHDNQQLKSKTIQRPKGNRPVLTLEVTNDNFHGVHRLELYIVAFLKNHCIANTGHKNINKIPLCC